MVRLGDVFVWLVADWRASVCWLRADPMNPPLRGVVPPDRLSAMPPVRAFTPAAPRPVPAESAPGAVPPAAGATSSPSRPASKRAASNSSRMRGEIAPVIDPRVVLMVSAIDVNAPKPSDDACLRRSSMSSASAASESTLSA